MTTTQHEVYARVVWGALDLAELGGLPRAELFAGLPFDSASVRGLKRVAWTDYISLIENIGRLAGDGLEDLLESSYHQVYPEFRTAFGALIDSKQLVRFMATIANPLAFISVTHQFEDLGGRRVRVSARLRPGARHCETWFRGSIGAWRGVPRYLDQPPAEVTAQIGPDFGSYDIVLPESRTIASRVLNQVGPLVRFVLGREPDGTPVAATIQPLPHDPFELQLDAAVARWKLTPRQLHVLRRIANGESTQEMVDGLAWPATTIEIVLAQLLAKSGASSRTDLIARLWNAD